MINVGIIGFGTVGSGTVKILLENKDVLKERLGFEINLKKIATRNVNRERGIKVSDDMVIKFEKKRFQLFTFHFSP